MRVNRLSRRPTDDYGLEGVFEDELQKSYDSAKENLTSVGKAGESSMSSAYKQTGKAFTDFGRSVSKMFN